MHRRIKDEIAGALGSTPTGPHVKWIIACRTLLQTYSPEDDGLSRQAVPILETVAHLLLPGTLLDIGCYGGWVYPHLKRLRPDIAYEGADIWGEALEAARMTFRGVTFHKMDVRSFRGQWDNVWCSQLILRGEEQKRALNRCFGSSRLCVFASPVIDWHSAYLIAEHCGGELREIGPFDPNGVCIYRRTE